MLIGKNRKGTMLENIFLTLNEIFVIQAQEDSGMFIYLSYVYGN